MAQEKLSVIETIPFAIILGMKTIADRIRFLRENVSGVSQEEFAMAIGVTRGAVGNWELGGKISYNNMKRISGLYNIPTAWIADGQDADNVFEQLPKKMRQRSGGNRKTIQTKIPQTEIISHKIKTDNTSENVSKDDLLSFKYEGENFNEILNKSLIPASLAVKRLSELLDSSLMVSQDVVDTVPMPGQLAGVPDAYALFVAGRDMEPRYCPGDTILIHPHLEPRVRDGVVAYSPDGRFARVNAFVRSTTTEWILRRYQPVEEEFSLLKSEWPKLHVILGVFSR